MGAPWQLDITTLPAGEPPNRRKPISKVKVTFWLLVLLLCIAAGFLLAEEVRTSRLQAQELSRYAQTLSYQVKPGPSPSIIYPKEGPFDKRQGYTYLPLMLERLGQRNFIVQQQAQFSPALLDYAQRGLFIPTRKKSRVACASVTAAARPSMNFATRNSTTQASTPSRHW